MMRRYFKGYEPGYHFWTAYLFILPALAIYGVFVFWPILQTVRYSLFEWNGLDTPQFVGFSNYVDLYHDEIFRVAFQNNLTFILFYTAFPIIIALFLTAILTRRKIFGLTFFRAGLFLPYVMSMVVVGVVWRWIYNPIFGPLNEFLEMVGLESWKRAWLGDFDLALPAVGVIGTWVQYGFCLVLFIAGVQRIEEELYDAAKIDGANEFRQLWHITLPALRSEIAVAMVTTLISALRVFDLVYVTTRGLPGNKTMVVSFHLYQNAFEQHKVGYAASIAVTLTSVILFISFLIIQWRKRVEENV
ncbi:MAG TPA: sugar ABC transporter permease [Aggregatilineaceae bacterium]|nr:sugar ABC transporter permease [Aggregatilineaceae bacterium]